MEVKKRVSYPLGMFDLVKGFAMIVVVLFHTVSFADVSPWISAVVDLFGAFLMACFFAISGFQFRPAQTKQAVKRYAKTYLPMYARLAVVVWLFMLVLNIDSLLMYLSAFLLGKFYPQMIGPVYVGGIGLGWFLLGLFWGSVLLNLVLKIKNRYLRVLCVFALAMLGGFLDIAQIDYLCLYRGLSALPAMYVGYCIYTSELLSRNESGWRRFLPYFLLVLTVPLIFCQIESAWMGLAWIIGEMLWGYAAVCLSRDTVNSTNALFESIRRIGRYTPWIIIVHGMEMICFPWERAASVLGFISNGNVKFFVLLLARFVMIFIGCVIIGKIDRVEKQLKRERRRKKRAQKKIPV